MPLLRDTISEESPKPRGDFAIRLDRRKELAAVAAFAVDDDGGVLVQDEVLH